MRKLFKDAEHLFRMAGLFAIGTTSILVLRAFLVPADFGVLGHFRAGAIDDNAAQALLYAGHESCADCHDEIVELRTGGRHQRISCETCHGPSAEHADDPSAAPASLPRVGLLCVNCHRVNAARPAFMPQVDPEEHSEGELCGDCHDPHRPGFD